MQPVDTLLLVPPLAPLMLHPELGCPQLTAVLRRQGLRVEQVDLNAIMVRHLRSPAVLERLLGGLSGEGLKLATSLHPYLVHRADELRSSLALPTDASGEKGRHLCYRHLEHMEGVLPRPWDLRQHLGSDRPLDPESRAKLARLLLGASETHETPPLNATPPLEMRWLLDVGIDELVLHEKLLPGDLDPESVAQWVNRPDAFFDSFLEEHLDPLLEARPNIVGLSVVGHQQLIAALRIADRVQRVHPAAFVAMGGPWCSAAGELLFDLPFLFDHVAGICRTEGEQTLLALNKAMIARTHPTRVPGLMTRQGGRVVETPSDPVLRLEEIGPPCFDGIDFGLYREPVVPFRTMRGCSWGRCVFCYHMLKRDQAHALPEQGTRMSDTQLDQLASVLHDAGRRGIRQFTFADNATPPSHLAQVAAMLRRERLDVEWVTLARCSDGFTAALCRELHAAGCRMIFYGLETACDSELRRLRKGIERDAVLRCLESTTAAGIAARAFVLDYPSQPPTAFAETLSFVCDHHEIIDRFIPMRFELARNVPAFSEPRTLGLEIPPSSRRSLSVFHLPFSAPGWNTDKQFRDAVDGYAMEFIRRKVGGATGQAGHVPAVPGPGAAQSGQLSRMLRDKDGHSLRVRLYHLPVEETDPPLHHGPLINIMPLGLLALADALSRRGHQVEVIHAGVERRLSPTYSVAEEIARDMPDLVGFSLHWHHQLGPVSAVLEELARRTLDVRVVLGGMTASAFAHDLLNRFPAATFVIRGEAELPLVQLAAWQSDGTGNLQQIPNLTYRRAGEVVDNELAYVATKDDLDGLDFVRADLLRHRELNNSQFAPSGSGWSHPPVSYLAAGRGCSVDCSFCSGGRTGHQRLSGRRAPVFRSASRLVEDMKKLLANGIGTACVCFDPPSCGEHHFRDVFQGVRDAGLRMGMVFECYAPPSEAFIQDFASTFDRSKSLLSFSPTVQDEALRGRLLGKSFTNAALETALARSHERGIATTLYFAIVPQETRDQLDGSLRWQADLVRRFHCRVIHSPIEMEPLAPWARGDSTLGLSGVRENFDSFLARHRRTDPSPRIASELGYDFADVDARSVRVASALASPGRYFGRAMATCGQGLLDRQVIVGPGEWERATRMLSRWRGRAMTLLTLAHARASEDWACLSGVAELLGARVRVIGLGPGVARHAAWDGSSVPAAPAAGVLLLHLEGEAAARRMAETGSSHRLDPGVVISETCRWASRPCPAREPRMLGFARGAVRPCPSSPDLGADWNALEARLQARVAETEHDRGCEQCPVRDECPRCLYTGPIPEAVYCELRRAYGPRLASDRGWAQLAGQDGPGISLGWDD